MKNININIVTVATPATTPTTGARTGRLCTIGNINV